MTEVVMQAKVKKVKAGELDVRNLTVSSFVQDRYPQDGIVVQTTATASQSVFISNNDLNKLRDLRENEWLTCEGWNDMVTHDWKPPELAETSPTDEEQDEEQSAESNDGG